MFDLRSYLKAKRTLVDTHLEHFLGAYQQDRRLIQAMRHSLMAGGKRLRPILCIAGAEAVGGKAEVTLSAACALEMIHTYSLIHDDLPAMDDDELRRGLPTCHVAFDEATAILAGDALLTSAFELLTTHQNSDAPSPRVQLEVTRCIAAAAGCLGMIEGQMRDMEAENERLDLEALERLHLMKTGALIKASVVSGALLGCASTVQQERLETYARCIGLAFQVKDDILNVEGDPALLGKGVGTDADRHKSTYPSLMGLEASKALAQKLIDQALHALADFDQRADPLRAIATYIIQRHR